MTTIFVSEEIDRCVAAIEAAISPDARKPATLYRDLLLELRYPAKAFQLDFSTPAAMIQFVEHLRDAPSLEVAAHRLTRRSCIDYLRRVQQRTDATGARFYKPADLALLDAMIVALEALTDADPALTPATVDHAQ